MIFFELVLMYIVESLRHYRFPDCIQTSLWQWNDCIKLASSTMDGNCRTVISTSTELMCSANPCLCAPQENRSTTLFRAGKRTVNVQWCHSATGILSLMLSPRILSDLLCMLTWQHRQAVVAWMYRECYGTIPPSVWYLVWIMPAKQPSVYSRQNELAT